MFEIGPLGIAFSHDGSKFILSASLGEAYFELHSNTVEYNVGGSFHKIVGTIEYAPNYDDFMIVATLDGDVGTTEWEMYDWVIREIEIYYHDPDIGNGVGTPSDGLAVSCEDRVGGVLFEDNIRGFIPMIVGEFSHHFVEDQDLWMRFDITFQYKQLTKTETCEVENYDDGMCSQSDCCEYTSSRGCEVVGEPDDI